MEVAGVRRRRRSTPAVIVRLLMLELFKLGLWRWSSQQWLTDVDYLYCKDKWRCAQSPHGVSECYTVQLL